MTTTGYRGQGRQMKRWIAVLGAGVMLAAPGVAQARVQPALTARQAQDEAFRQAFSLGLRLGGDGVQVDVTYDCERRGRRSFTCAVDTVQDSGPSCTRDLRVELVAGRVTSRWLRPVVCAD